MSEQPTKFCKDCANFKAPDLCFIGDGVNVINGAMFPTYADCVTMRTEGYLCGPDATMFLPNPDKSPAHRSSLGFILGNGNKRSDE